MAKLLCGHIDDDADELTPAALNDNFIGLAKEGSAKEVTRLLITALSEHLTACSGNCGSIIKLHMGAPLGVISQVLAVAFASGHLTGALLHEQGGMVSQSLATFSLLKANEGSSSCKCA